MTKFRFFFILLAFGLMIFAGGCTVHFKGENVEFDSERQRVYYLTEIDFFKGSPFGGYICKQSKSKEGEFAKTDSLCPSARWQVENGQN